MNEIYYPLSDETKRQLGLLIKGTRAIKYQFFKAEKNSGSNPYTKINLIDHNGICHYNTYLKLENNIVKDDQIYYRLLDKLDLKYQVDDATHQNTMHQILSFALPIVQSIEFLDRNKINDIKEAIAGLPIEQDCIANAYYEMIVLRYELMDLNHTAPLRIQKIKCLYDLFEGLYHGVALNCIAIDYVNHGHEKALHYLDLTRNVYATHHIDEGILIYHYLRYYYKTREYYHLIEICNRYEEYFQIKNDKRLMIIYFYLSQYYSNIHHLELAREYHNKGLALISRYFDDLGSYYFVFYYDYGYQLFKYMHFNESLSQLEKALYYCNIEIYRFELLVILMILHTYLHHDDEIIAQLIKDAEVYYEHGNEIEQYLFKYFKYKIESPNYYRRYSFEQLIPLLKQNVKHKDYLLFIYHDLYL
jgi:hypothetical protein